jgi:hypothetical protein
MRHQLNRFLTVFKTRKNIGFYRSLAYRSLPKNFGTDSYCLFQDLQKIFTACSYTVRV